MLLEHKAGKVSHAAAGSIVEVSALLRSIILESFGNYGKKHFPFISVGIKLSSPLAKQKPFASS